MATAKVVNYTPEQTATMRALYGAAPNKATVATIAAMFGKTTKSVVAKLSREGVYVKAEYVSKTGEKPIRKDAMVGVIAGLMGVSEESLDGLEKAPKGALLLVANALKAQRDGDPSEGEFVPSGSEMPADTESTE